MIPLVGAFRPRIGLSRHEASVMHDLEELCSVCGAAPGRSPGCAVLSVWPPLPGFVWLTGLHLLCETG